MKFKVGMSQTIVSVEFYEWPTHLQSDTDLHKTVTKRMEGKEQGV